MTIIALYLALAILAGLAVMQTFLIFGAPIGHFAWGGKHRILPARQRVAAGAAIVLYAGFAALLLSRSGILANGHSLVIVVATWILFGYSVLSVLPNLASKSRQERAVQTPVSIALAITIGLVASGPLV